MREYVVKGGRPLRLGYTTGSCATAAAAAAAEMLLTGGALEQALIRLPGGEELAFGLGDVELAPGRASCSVVKDAGDDPDVTDGIKIFAECSFAPDADAFSVILEGGAGIGTVTGAGLQVPPGQAAINPVPRRMILENVAAAARRHAYGGALRVVISAPGGEEIAKKTFNPRLGIEGGISILGTTGIVEPMSERAIVDTVKLLIDKRHAEDAENILITPGNYGRAFCQGSLGLDMDKAVKFSNFLGECLDYLRYKGFKRILLVGHAGKLFKAAGGVMNTHSSVADCRMEILAAHAACAGTGAEAARALMRCKTVDEAVAVLRGSGLAEKVFESVLQKIIFHLEDRLAKGAGAAPAPELGVIVFSGDEILMRSAGAVDLLQYYRADI